MGPDQRIVKYAEFAAKFDVHEALDMTGRNLSLVEFYNLDVFAAMAGLALTALLVALLLLKFAVKLVFHKVTAKTKWE